MTQAAVTEDKTRSLAFPNESSMLVLRPKSTGPQPLASTSSSIGKDAAEMRGDDGRRLQEQQE